MVFFFGGKGMDIWGGGSGNDFAWGDAGTDFLYGYGGNDYLNGGAGNDFLNGGEGMDTIVGGTGRDIMTGGIGGDTFVFTGAGESGVTTATADIITDFGNNFWDNIDVPSWIANGSNRVFTGTSVNSIELATTVATNLDHAIAGHDAAMLFANYGQNTSYLVMDMDLNGSYETGVVLQGMGNPTSTVLDLILV
jgi:Ca2+-binding RTX toxin-like protein